MDRRALLNAYDRQLRAEAEVAGADDVRRLGPLLLATFGGRQGFVTYPTLAGLDGPEHSDALEALIAQVVAWFEARPEVDSFEWKTRGHDAPADLPARLVRAGLQAGEAESVLIGEASGLAVGVPLPDGFALRRAASEADVRAAHALAAEVFGDDPVDAASHLADALRRHADPASGSELWLVEHAGRVVCTGRLEPVAGTEFAGLWGGACAPGYRGRGLYRALTSARARSALARGLRFVHSDSTEFSRPILERSGLVKVTTTTPYLWRRPRA